MARERKAGKAQDVTPENFNERVKRLPEDKPDPCEAEPRGKTYKANTPFAKG